MHSHSALTIMSLRKLNLTVIADRSCSTSRTYLHYLSRSGFKVSRLWLVEFGEVSRRMQVAESIFGTRIMGWYLRRKCPPPYLSNDSRYRDLCMGIQSEAGVEPIDYFSSWDCVNLADEVSRFHASDFNDKRLQQRITGQTKNAFLYTNGGILPGEILNASGVRFLHVHPGAVPAVRGSDCLLWSAHVHRHLGFSCFYMNSGIDEGNLIAVEKYEVPKLPGIAPFLTPAGEDMAYRALSFAVDPHYRAKVLVNAIKEFLDSDSCGDLRMMPSRRQADIEEKPYLWMHPRLRLEVMRRAFL